MIKTPTRNEAGRVNLSTNPTREVEFPNLIEAQIKSFDQFLESGFQTLFDQINPVKDSMERMWTLEFKKFRYGEPYRSIDDSARKGLSYEAPVYATVQLLNNRTGEIKEQEIFISDLPLMTEDGFFVVNGVRRVVTHQIVRAEGVLFEAGQDLPGRTIYNARLMPNKGPWYEFEVNKSNVISIRLAPKRPKVLITELYRIMGYESDEAIKKLFSDVDTHEENKYIDGTLARDFTKNKEEAIISVYNKLRPDESVTLDSAEKYIKAHFFDTSRFDLGKVGRYQLNRKLGTDVKIKDEENQLTIEDITLTLKRLININNGAVEPDDIDHLSNRRIRSVGEVLVRQLNVGIRRLEKNIKDKMSMYGQDAKVTPSMLISTKPISAAVQAFFGSNALSSFMEQSNILSELEEKRRVTASGPGGILKARAPFSAREVHYSHYSRFDPVTTPESQGIGVVLHLAVLSRINEYGFIEAPYYKVQNVVKPTIKDLTGRIAKEGISGIVKAGELITEEKARKISKKVKEDVAVYPFVTDEIEYFDPASEVEQKITIASVDRDQNDNIMDRMIPTRHKGDFVLSDSSEITHIDILSSQQAGVGMSLIPYVSSNDAKRALTGSNMQRQAVPLLKNEAPLVGTGMESVVARQSNWCVFAEEDGEVLYADAAKLTVKYKKEGIKDYIIQKFYRSNDNGSFSQTVKVNPGDKFKRGDLLVDGPSVKNGELATGTNLRAALMPFEGYNYEDSVIISERVVKEDLLTSITIREHKQEIRDTELGPETLTADIPHVSERVLQKLDSDGIARNGVRVTGGDILIGVVGPRGEQELTAEEKLLRAIFGEASSDVKDSSKRLPHGEDGVVVRSQVLSVENGDKLAPGVLKEVKIWVAETKKIDYGDKLAGRHGDKNTIASIRPVEDMPFTEDGEPVDIVLTPLIVKRMNMGQAAEVHIGRYAELLGEKFALPIFEHINMEWLENELNEKGFNTDQKVDLYDGRTGEKFPRKITVGKKYVLKLHHIADEKVHARSTGPYTVVTQQPLGGKAQMGGQRFGEMEVWALEAHGAPATLKDMLTIKSDDVKGRSAAYKAIIHGEKIENVNMPESFKVLVKELNALGMKVDLISEEKPEEEVEASETEGKEEENNE